jgi:UDP-N-acetylglucosamine--N-acetylmuramyl-(pentapeptide) pyrophosphoryl-undecaprenol N-acetylglucosamine transferase
VPIVVHEANPRPGLANRIGARLTTHVFTGNPGTSLPHARYIGIPLRREITELDRAELRDKARAHFGFRPDLPVLMVTGGSQGARSINRAVFAAAASIRQAGVQLLHITGPKAEVEPPLAGEGPAQVVVPYMDRMDLAYAAADLVLCRSGAMTCAELTAVGLPAAFVPLPHGNGEQMLNAEPIVRAGGAVVVEDSQLTRDWIMATVQNLLLDPSRIAQMSRAAAALGRRDADTQLASEVLTIASERQ